MPRAQHGRRLWVNIVLWGIIIGFGLGVIIYFIPGGFQILDTNPDQAQEVALSVNGDKIFQSEVDFALQSLIEQYRQLYQQIQSDFDEQLQGASGAYYQLQLRSQAVDGLIRNQILRQEIRKRKISVPQTQVDLRFRERYEQFLRTNQVTEQRLIELLQNPQIQEFFNLRTGTLAEFKSKLRSESEFELQQERLKDAVVGQLNPSDKELLDFVSENKGRYLSRLIGSVVPTDEELQAYFEQHKDQYAKEEVKASHIFLALAQDAPDVEVQAARQQLEGLRKQLAKGADFAELAKEYSEDEATRDTGGDLGYFVRGESRYGSVFEDAAFALDVGKVSDIVRTEQGLHLIQVTDRRTKGFADVKDQLKQDLSEELENQRFEAWLKAAQEEGVFPQSDEIRARHILIKVSSTASEEEVQAARQKIEEIQKQLMEGADFAELAKQYSEDAANSAQGGDLGWFGHGRMVDEFDQAAFALQEGQISGPVRTQFGFHLIQLLERRKTDAIKQEVKDAYNQEQTDKRYEDWVKQTTDSATIEILDELLAAYRLEERARREQDPDAKLKLFDEALTAYSKVRQNLESDPYLGYYESQLYQEKLDLLEEKEKNLGEGVTEEERQALQDQIDSTRKSAVKSFLESSSSYGERDASSFEKMVELAADNADLRVAYARFLLEQKDDDDGAYEQLKKAVELNPNYWQALLLAADIQTARSVYTAAVEHLKRALQIVAAGTREQRDIRFKLGQAYLNLARQIDRDENLAQAEQVLTQLKDEYNETDQKRAEVLSVLGDVYMEKGSYPQAQEAYREALKLTNRLETEVKLGRAYFIDKQLDQAEKSFQSVVARDVYNVQARIGLGDVYGAKGQTDKALENYRTALDLRADSATRRDIAKKILELDPNDTKTRFRLAQLYLDEGAYSSAIEQYQAILSADPESWQAHSGLGDAYLGLNEFAQAKDHYRSALLLEAPSDQQVRLWQKVLEAEQGVVGGVLNPLGPDGQEAMLQLAELYIKQGSAEKAKEQLKMLQSDYPDYQPTRVAELMALAEGKALPGEAVEDQGREHVQPGQSHPPYNSKPPTSGWHLGSTADWGVHQEPIPDELQIHNLEHGGVLIQYEPNIDQSVVEQLTALVTRLREQPKYCKLILAPYPTLDKPIALTAWTRILKLDAFDENRVVGFIDAWIEKGPEKNIPCQ